MFSLSDSFDLIFLTEVKEEGTEFWNYNAIFTGLGFYHITNGRNYSNQTILNLEPVHCNLIQNMKNSGRMRMKSTINSPSFSDNWQDQYFPISGTRKNTDQWFKESSDFPKENHPQNYQKLAKIYQEENREILARNNSLLETVRELKEKESFLMQEIAVLELYHKKLQQKEPFKEINKENCNSLNKMTHGTCKSIKVEPQTRAEEIELPLRNQKELYMRALNDQFCRLVEESIAEKDSNKRKVLRKELSELAAQIKKARSQIQDQVGQGLKKTHQVSENTTSKTLAPYLETPLFKNPSKDQLAHSNSTNKLRKLGAAAFKG